jgi:hypothetical protein
LVTETFDAALIGEGALSIFNHARTGGFLKSTSIVIPSSAEVFVQLLESTFSLRRGENNSNFLHSGKFNLEPMRRFRAADVYTVRYLNEQNAVRQRLSPIYTLFSYDFQNYEPSANFAYICVILEITESG